MHTVPFFCGKDCGGDACPLLASIDGDRVVRITNNPAGGRFVKGCRRGFDLPLEQRAPGRILTPLIRNGERGAGQFRTATWDEALDLIAARLGDIRARYGADAVLNRASAGVLGALHGTPALGSRFLSLFGGYTRLTGNYSNAAAMFVLPYVLGDDWARSGWDAATMQHAQMIIMWGANVLETRLGSEVPQRLMQAKKRGAQVVVVDPRRSATVQHAATWWLPCRPGADAALMLAVLHVLVSEDLVDRPFIAAHSVGFPDLERYVLGNDGATARTPQWAAGICGVEAGEIVRFARAYAAAKPAMLFPGYSIQRVFGGEETFRLSVALQVATGNFGVRGGSTGSLNNRLPTPRVGSLPPVAAPGVRPAVPVLRWPDAILQGRAGGFPTDIHAAYFLGSNAVNQGGDVRKAMAAMARLDFAVTHEVFMTPTARWCDVILPATTALEKEDIGIPWLGNYLLYKPQALAPSGQARSDYDALWDLAQRMGFGEAFSGGRTAAQWMTRFIEKSEIPDAEAFRRTGVYFAPEQERVGLADFAADPARHPLRTPSGKVEIASAAYAAAAGAPAIPVWRQPPGDKRYPLSLVTPKSPNRTHSQGSNVAALRRREPHALSMHPADAARRGIVDGAPVHILNAQGTSQVRVHVTDEVMPGVVSLPEGIWADIDGQLDLAGSANVLTSTDGTSPSTGCIMHAVAVEVRAA